MSELAQADEQSPCTVYCLCIDMIGSTEAGLKMTSQELDTFNRALVKQIAPHLQCLGLTDALLKFTGDGWLLMTNQESRVPALCCLATVMANRFQAEMHDMTDTAMDRIPALRQAICAGRDIAVELPSGSRDWVGDSARRAQRASGCCHQNEVLVDYSVRTPVSRDFEIDEVNVQKRVRELKVKRMEEKIPLYRLGEPRVEAAARADAPEHFVYTLTVIGRYDAAEASVEKMVEEGVRPAVVTYNMLIAHAPDYHTAKSWLKTMRKDDVPPNVVTYSTLINRAPDYDMAKRWLGRMRKEGVPPDVVTYNTLIKKAPEYDLAKRWLGRMREKGMPSNVVTYTTLIRKAPDYDTAKGWLKTMREEGVPPDVVTYYTLINKAPDFDTAKSWLETMREKGVSPKRSIYYTLMAKAPDYDTAKEWLGRMREDGVSPKPSTYYTLINKAPGYDTAKEWLGRMREDGVSPKPSIYYTLMAKAPNYDTAKEWLGRMREDGVPTNLFTYYTLMAKAPNYDTAKEWLERMRDEGVRPDVLAYKTLIAKAPDYDTAKQWMRTMRKEGVSPNALAYNALITRSPDYHTAMRWLGRMRQENVRPNVATYTRLFGKDLSAEPADTLLKWYLAQERHPEKPIETAIATYWTRGQIDQALRLVLDYTHLPPARQLIREYEGQAIAYFREALDGDPEHPNPSYALGVALLELGRELEAEPYLRKALELARAGPRRTAITDWLQEIESGRSPAAAGHESS